MQVRVDAGCGTPREHTNPPLLAPRQYAAGAPPPLILLTSPPSTRSWVETSRSPRPTPLILLPPHPTRSWVEISPAAGAPARRTSSRTELEALLEADAAAEGRAWLGQLANGGWEIRAHAVNGALAQLLSGLIVLGLIRVLTPERSGKAGTNYVAANRYVTGTSFPRARLSRPPPPAKAEEEEELCDLEKERLANMKRNQELLRQLGLA